MRRLLQSNRYSSESMSPMLNIIYYDDGYNIYECLFKLSAELSQELNIRGSIGEIKIESIDTFFEISDMGYNSCRLVKDEPIQDFDINELESNIQTHIKELKRLYFNDEYINKSYESVLDNIKQYRRQKNLDILL